MKAAWAALCRAYATADPRSLGLFRIALGTLLFFDVLRRWPDLAAHYSNSGWLPNHFALFRPMSSHLFSVYHIASTPTQVKVLVALHLLVNLALLVGYRTRLMQVLAALLITSINSRNIMLENGGWVVLHLLCVWTLFLPLGRRYSVDSWLARLRARREGTLEALNDRALPVVDTRPVVSLAITALLLQWAVIYFFNTVHKNGEPWRDGTAVYYFFQQDRMVTSLGAWVREQLPLGVIRGLTWGTLVIEGLLVVLLLTPVYRGFARKLALFLIGALHLTIDAVVQLGPFSWAMFIMLFALVPSAEDWERIDGWLRARRQPRVLYLDPAAGCHLWLGRVVKRLDTLGKVRFAGITELPEERRGEARVTLLVSDAGGSTFWSGVEGLARLGDALPLPRPLTAWPRLFGLRWVVARGLRTWASEPARLDARYGLGGWPGTDRVSAGERPVTTWLRGVASRAATLAVLLLMVALGSQVLEENRAVPAALKVPNRPAWMTAVVVYPRLFQGWSMFAPAPPGEDGRIVVDGRTADGRSLDPLTGAPPRFEVQPKDGFRMNQIWGDFHRRIAEPRFAAYLPGVRDMLLRYHELTGRKADRLVAFDVWHVVERIPPPGAPREPPSRRKILSHGVVR